MDHSTKQTIADVAKKTIELIAAFFLGKKAYKEYKKSRMKKE